MAVSKTFDQLGLVPTLLSTLSQLGYEVPTPIQAQSIPTLLEGHDLVAQAQTGTGKTAAFALPILSKVALKTKAPQALVITPTRELAIQVAEAFQSYAKSLEDFHVAPIYGGQEYRTQLRALKRGAHVVVGTPGRVMDHINRGSLRLDALKTIVLDEGDEMLRMGFVEDIEWILEQIPQRHQTALFSATMPESIQKIANRYLHKPRKIEIKAKKGSIESIEQCFVRVVREQKLEALTRFLEVEETQATIIFARTKTSSAELAEKLQARGYTASALNGDMKQTMRKHVVDQIKNGQLDIVVATDVAARGIDVDRVSHVINFDIPYDTEAYIHRIGRTGRAGRTGKAISLITPREQRFIAEIERATQKPIKQIYAPSVKMLHEKRGQQLTESLMGLLAQADKLAPYEAMIEQMLHELHCAPKKVAAALVCMMQDNNPIATEELKDVAAEAPRPRRRPPRNRGAAKSKGAASKHPARRGKKPKRK